MKPVEKQKVCQYIWRKTYRRTCYWSLCFATISDCVAELTQMCKLKLQIAKANHLNRKLVFCFRPVLVLGQSYFVTSLPSINPLSWVEKKKKTIIFNWFVPFKLCQRKGRLFRTILWVFPSLFFCGPLGMLLQDSTTFIKMEKRFCPGLEGKWSGLRDLQGSPKRRCGVFQEEISCFCFPHTNRYVHAAQCRNVFSSLVSERRREMPLWLVA